MSASIVAQLLYLESDNADKGITLYINSPGGSVTAGIYTFYIMIEVLTDQVLQSMTQ